MTGLTTTYHKINAMTKPWRIVQGGQGAGKNYAIESLLLVKAGEKKRTITIVTDTFENLKDGAIQDYKNIFYQNGLSWSDHYNESKKDLTWGDSIIQFRYVVGHKKQAGKSKRRDILYVNETTKVPYSAVEHYIARTSEYCYFDLNPDFETWVHTQIEPDPRSEKIIVTYRDNEFCPQAEIDFIESRKDNKEWYRVYGLGLTGTYSDLRIYQFEIINEIPEGIKRLASGMDFGVSPDPTCLVSVYRKNNNLYCEEVFSENNLLPEKIQGAERYAIVDKLEEVQHQKQWPTVADSSGKTEILDIKRHGYNIKAVKKPQGSVLEGIKKVRSYNIYVTSDSKNMIKGFENWFWKEDHNGNIVPEPKGHEPDTLAALRYVMLYEANSTKRLLSGSTLL